MTAIALGATLYVPVLHPRLLQVVSGSIPDLRSIVVCLEDSLRDDQVDEARAAYVRFLDLLPGIANRLTVYVRPRDLQMFYWMLGLPASHAIDGFVLPKVDTVNVAQWLAPMTGHDYRFMPTIEGAEAFDRGALEQLCRQLMSFQERVTAIRIGGNDILNVLGVRRSKNRTAYDGPLGSVIRDMATTFIPAGFAVAAPVFEHYASPERLREEVEQDLEHGLCTKTAIHPSQIEVIHGCYAPSHEEVREARAILEQNAHAVFASDGSMCEPATHRRWAGNVITRLQHFSTADANNLAAMLVA